MLRATLFADDRAEEIEDWRAALERLSDKQLLWLDLRDLEDGEVEEVAEALVLDEISAESLRSASGEVRLRESSDRAHVSTLACQPGGDDPARLVEIECVIGNNWALTAYAGEVDAIEEFRERVSGRTALGRLDSPSFLATLLEWVVAGYLRAFGDIETELEEFDVRALTGVETPDDLIEQLVAVRRQVGHLRRALAPHREVFAALAHPEYDAISSSESARRFQDLAGRLDAALQAARDSREAIVGSFDVLIARYGHRTNEIMKVLTIASVLLLPGALIAGVMGMNFQVGLFDHEWLYWAVVAVIVLIAGATVVVARRRRWI